MRKKIFILSLFLISVFIISGCGRKNSSNSKPIEPKKDDSQMVWEVDFKGSVNDLIKAANPVRCTFATQENNKNQKNTIYVSANNFKLDSELTLEKKVYNIHFLKLNEQYFFWDEDQPKQGIKVLSSSNELKEFSSSISENYLYIISKFDESFDFKCQPRLIDSAIFVAPLGIEFNDLKQSKKSSLIAKENLCSMCAQLATEAKTQCTDLYCNKK